MALGALELGFSINAGPLSQIGVQILNIQTAVQLATGAYGWWKARERCQSLTTVLGAAGCDLVTAPTFNSQQYVLTRQNHHVIGTFVQHNALTSTSCPKASSAISEDPGMNCLRALTTALLCIYTVEATSSVLAAIIPYGLLQKYQEDSDIDIEGPLLSSLKMLVSAIAAEEDSSTYRAFLLKLVHQEETSLFQSAGSTRIPQGLPQASADTALSIAMLKWALTAVYRRKVRAYVTKSLTVWALAAILKAVGFEISASPTLLVSDEETDSWADAACTDAEISSDVMLSTSWYGNTDPYFSTYVPETEKFSLKPQLMSIQSIPYAVFKHLRQDHGKQGIEYAADAFAFVYRKVQKMSVKVLVRERGNTSFLCGSRHDGSDRLPTRFQRTIMHAFSPHLTQSSEISNAIIEYIPATSFGPEWDETLLLSAFDHYRDGSNEHPVNASIRESFSICQALILAVAYGLVSHLLQDAHGPVSELSEVMCSPEILKSGKLMSVVSMLCRILNDKIGLDYWNLCGIINELILGRPAIGPGLPALEPSSRLVVGMQANGMTAVSGLILKPSTNTVSIVTFHIAAGQILNLPLTDDNCVVLQGRDKPLMSIGHSMLSPTAMLGPFESADEGRLYRIDAEPCWEDDPRELVFRVRREGVPAATLSSPMLIRQLLTDQNVNLCSCGSLVNKHPSPPAEDWRQLPICSIIPAGKGLYAAQSMGSWRKEVGHKERVLIDVNNSDQLLFVVLGLVYSRRVVFASDCIPCAYRHYESNLRDGGVAMIITRILDRSTTDHA